MKKYISVITIFFALVTWSCSNDNIEEPDMTDNELSLTNYIYTTFNVTSTPNTAIASTNYAIENDKIISASGTNFTTSTQRDLEYYYSNDRIDSILTYTDGSLSRTQTYMYHTNGDLKTYLSESVVADNEPLSIDRHTYTHTTDTIYSTWMSGENGADPGTFVLASKIVLDNNNNRTYYESYSPSNQLTKSWVGNFDANQNLQNESFYSSPEDSFTELLFENSYTTSGSENIFNRINEATYTRKNMMLLYHLQPGAVNSINAKSVSKDALVTFDSTWGNSFANYEILNTSDDMDNIISSDYKTIVAGEVLSRFTQDYIFQ